ncbi:SLOG family protein [Bailinhaonella thermotolerans]|uniref:DUF2493 domain-containing protein n=1 Tax=Bailinhaonella thermotolerans TaxID=1070861 RepID=A0A3A4AX17_9ACTN|nr:SLOG family protein [Bailinhaonella thermotolerans]RJL23972.1 DUF2493 domain-containing protein [Bailinhaonella thermotolerans]
MEPTSADPAGPPGPRAPAAGRLAEPRVLVCGSRWWPWPDAVAAALDGLARRYGDGLVVIEGAARGADDAAHRWCLRHGLGDDRHRCHPVNWAAEKRARPRGWKAAGPERNTRMLGEDPHLILAFHDRLDPAAGGTSDMCLRGLLSGVPVWHIPGADPRQGRWLALDMFPTSRIRRVRAHLTALRRTAQQDPPPGTAPTA